MTDKSCACGFNPPGHCNPDCERCQLILDNTILRNSVKKLEEERKRIVEGKKVSMDLTLFDDESVEEKLTVCTPLDVVFDDERNEIPDEYYNIVENLKPGDKITVTIERRSR